MTSATTGLMPRDFAVLLPPGWTRIRLDGREIPITAGLVAAKVAGLPPAEREQARQLLTRMLHDTLRRAREAGGTDVLISLAESHGVPIAASCLVTYLDRGDQVPLDGLLAELGAKGGEVTAVEIAGSPAIRRRSAIATPIPPRPRRAPASGAAGNGAAGNGTGDQPVSSAVTIVDYFLPVPGRPGVLALSFATPVEPLADALVLLFDAIAESLRWMR
jgi:hypothetical protein